MFKISGPTVHPTWLLLVMMYLDYTWSFTYLHSWIVTYILCAYIYLIKYIVKFLLLRGMTFFICGLESPPVTIFVLPGVTVADSSTPTRLTSNQECPVTRVPSDIWYYVINFCICICLLVTRAALSCIGDVLAIYSDCCQAVASGWA